MASAKNDGFDLGDLDTIEACNKPAEIEIKHPVTMVGIGVFVSVVGSDSDVYRSRVRAMADQNLRLQAVGKPNPNGASLDKLEAKNIEALVAATTAWRTETVERNDKGEIVKRESAPVVIVKGERLDLNHENARKVYAELLPVREQVSEAINNLANFMKG